MVDRGEDTPSNESRHPSSDISSERSDTPLPIWQWDDNSCSLDQILLIGLLILLAIGKVDLQCSEPLAFECLHGFISRWCRDGSWDSWCKKEMTRCRDAVRDIFFEKSIEIGPTSNIDQLVPNLIPANLRTMQCTGRWTCDRPACAELGVLMSKAYDCDTIVVNALQQKDNTIQRILDTPVYPDGNTLIGRKIQISMAFPASIQSPNLPRVRDAKHARNCEWFQWKSTQTRPF
jgi:hypothetical protein